MTRSDREQFATIWRAAWEGCGKAVTADTLRLHFAALEPYSMAEVRAALTRHVRDPKAGQYPPKPADIVRQIEGEPPDTDDIIAAARMARTPLGVMCRMQIGTWNLDHLDTFRLRPLAKECLALLPEWRHRIAAGRLLDHERTVMERYGVPMESRLLIAHQPEQANG